MKWAQRKDRLFITIDVQDCKNPNVDLQADGHLKFTGEAKETQYEIDLQLWGECIVDDSKWNFKGRSVLLSIAKKELEGEDEQYWPRFTKEKMKHPHIHVDWDKWVDEDEAEEAKDIGGDFDPSLMGGMPGMGGGGMPGMPGMGGMGGMPGMGGMGGMPGMEGMGGMDMQEMMKNMGGMGGMPGMPGAEGMGGGDSDDEDEQETNAGPKEANADIADVKDAKE